MDHEQEIMQIISKAGDARSDYLKALKKARNSKWNDVENLVEDANENLTEAHNVQTKLIQQEIKGESVSISLLMVHAQDHLMNAITVSDLSREIIEFYRGKHEKGDLNDKE